MVYMGRRGLGQHSDSVVSTSALQHRGPQFEFQPEHYAYVGFLQVLYVLLTLQRPADRSIGLKLPHSGKCTRVCG